MHILFKPDDQEEKARARYQFNPPFTLSLRFEKSLHINSNWKGRNIISSIGIFVSLVVNEARITIPATSQFVIPWMKFDFVLFSIRYPTTVYTFNSRIRRFVRVPRTRHFRSMDPVRASFHSVFLSTDSPLPISFLHSRGRYELTPSHALVTFSRSI